jgi:hypothetical protein
MALEKSETRKDTIQVAIESGFSHIGQIMSIIVTAGRDVTRELGDWASDIFEMREAARRARVDRGVPAARLEAERAPVGVGELGPPLD